MPTQPSSILSRRAIGSLMLPMTAAQSPAAVATSNIAWESVANIMTLHSKIPILHHRLIYRCASFMQLAQQNPASSGLTVSKKYPP